MLVMQVIHWSVWAWQLQMAYCEWTGSRRVEECCDGSENGIPALQMSEKDWWGHSIVVENFSSWAQLCYTEKMAHVVHNEHMKGL